MIRRAGVSGTGLWLVLPSALFPRALSFLCRLLVSLRTLYLVSLFSISSSFVFSLILVFVMLLCLLGSLFDEPGDLASAGGSFHSSLRVLRGVAPSHRVRRFRLRPVTRLSLVALSPLAPHFYASSRVVFHGSLLAESGDFGFGLWLVSALLIFTCALSLCGFSGFRTSHVTLLGSPLGRPLSLHGFCLFRSVHNVQTLRPCCCVHSHPIHQWCLPRQLL